MGAATTATPQGSLRQRNIPNAGKKTVTGVNGASDIDEVLDKAKTKANAAGSERDYKVTMVFITALAFLTRFWGINHPNEVVFDEVHFGKVHPTRFLMFLRSPQGPSPAIAPQGPCC